MNNTLEKLKAVREALSAAIEEINNAWGYAGSTNPDDACNYRPHLATLDSLIAEQEKGKCIYCASTDLSMIGAHQDMVRCNTCSGTFENGCQHRTASQQQPASSLVEAIEELKMPEDHPGGVGWVNDKLDLAIRLARQHTREPDVEAGARATGISHKDLCLLSRLFNQSSSLRTQEELRVNDWLKEAIERAKL